MPGRLSATLIVRDEARFLPTCLASIRDVADEIVVVDTGSVDDSVEIARSFGAVVVERPWTHDFSAARNAALELATGRWILYIDADEHLAPVVPAEVHALLDGAEEAAFRILLRPNAGYTPYREYRLWRHDDRIRFEGVIHERVVPAIHAVARADDRPIGTADLLLEHAGYEGDQTRKHLRNLPLLQVQVERDPQNLFVWNHLAKVLSGLGREAEAEAALERGIAIARAKPTVDRLGALLYLGLVARRLAAGDGDRAEALLAEARERHPQNWMLVWHEGRLRVGQGRLEDALACFTSLSEVDERGLPDLGPAYDRRLFGELAQEGRGACLLRLGRDAEAAEAFAAAARHAPGRPELAIKQRLAAARAARSA
jgi:tetratricopeptide (TPR) repeat protein